VLQDGYRFTHALLHEVLERELDSAQRKRAHAAAAQSLLCTVERGDARLDCRIARHWLECADDEAFQRAAQLAERAGQAARARGAYAEAAAAFGIVVAAQRKRLSLAPASPALQKALGRQLLAFAARLWRAGQLTQALAQYAEAAQIAQVIGDQRLLADAVLGSLGDVNGTMSPDQLALCELACRTCTECPLETRICLLARLGSELCFGTRRARGIELIEQAAQLGAGCTQPAVQFALLRAQRAAWDETVPFEQRRALLERRAQLAARHHDVVESVWSHAHFLMCGMEFVDAALTRTHYEHFAALAPRAGEPLVWWARVQGCTLALLQGEFDNAIKLAHEARQLGSQVPNVLTVFWSQWAAIRHLQGHTEEALVIRQRALEYWDRPELRAALAVQYSELGRGAEARLEFERAVAGNPETVYALCRVAEAAHALGESRVAATLYERLRPFDARCALATAGVVCIGAVAYYAGLAAITTGQRLEAVALFRKAITINHAMGAMPALAFSHYQLANAAARETPGEARGHARAALQLAQALGMTQFATRAESLCAELDRAAEPAAPQRGQAASVQKFQRRGEYWQIAYRGQSACVRDLKGMHYLEELLADPGQPKHVLELIAGGGEPVASALPASEGLRIGRLEGYERALDGACLASYRQRLHALAEEVQEAEQMHDLARQERLRRELAFLEQQLVTGSKARHRPTERARKAVYNRIRQAIQHIEDSHVELARHLVRTIQTGAHCVYRGESEAPWTTGSSGEH
jgi:tetratricopeptide (TPR) repeat protein